MCSTARAERGAGRGRPLSRLGLVATAALLAGCSVVPVPTFSPARGQGEREHEWDVADCKAEAGYQARYSPTDSPLSNLFQKIFFWGGAGASVGGLITGFPVSITAGPATDGLIAGASAGGVVAGVESLSGQRRYSGAFVTCMETKGYAMTPPAQKAEGAAIAVKP